MEETSAPDEMCTLASFPPLILFDLVALLSGRVLVTTAGRRVVLARPRRPRGSPAIPLIDSDVLTDQSGYLVCL